MRKIQIYTNGEAYIVDSSISMGIHGGEVVREIDITNATDEETESLRTNPNNQLLIDEIQKRVV